MPVRRLPHNPSVDHLKQQAKTLQRQVRAEEPEALALVAELSPRADSPPPTFRLADAQLVIARQYGFPSWPRLRAHLALVSRYSRSPHLQPIGGPLANRDALADELLRLACLTYGADNATRPARARELLAANPEVATANVYTMAAVGEADALAALLAREAELANRQGGPYRWEPLLYLAYARVEDDPPARSTLEAARLLLASGADPNAGFLWEGLPSPFTALTGAFGDGEDGVNQPPHQHSLALARLLLEAGADPNDYQTLYNRHFRPNDDHLALLLAYGLGRGEGGPWHIRLGSELASPAVMIQDQLVWAARMNYVDRVRLLLQHGVDVDGRGTRHPVVQGRTAHEVATLNGHEEVAALLRAAGASMASLDTVETFLAACLRADRAEVERLVTADPGLVAQAVEREPHVIIRAAETGRVEAVRLLAGLGFDANALHRVTALHQAAWAGDLEMVRLFLELGADPTVLDPAYNAPPLGWARHNRQEHVVTYLESLGPA